jgi:hypothetical protein
MAVPKLVTAQDIGRACADAVRDEPAAQRLWVSTHQGEFRVWLLVEPMMDEETELRLYGADLAMYARFPEADVFLLVINPSDYEPFDLRSVIPADAVEIALRSDG